MADVVKIEKIKILNFGPFYGEHEIEFPGDGSGVHIIRGTTGQGKTSLQRAVLWCLYGRVVDRKGDEIPPTSLLNHNARRDDIYKFGVVLFINHDGDSWTISRRMKASSHSDKKYHSGMEINVVRDGTVLPDPDHAIQRIIPEDVSRFYFFDGEMLRDYEELLEGDSHAMMILRDSIERVLGVPLFKTARDDLYAIQKKVESERNRLIRQLGGKDLDELANNLQTISDEIDARKIKIRKMQEQHEKLDSQMSDLKRSLTDIKAVQDLAQKRLELEKEIQVQETRRENMETELKELLSRFHKTILLPVAENVVQQLEIKHNTLMEKYNRKQELVGKAKALRQGIDGSKCTSCGTILDPTKLRRFESELASTQTLIDDLTEIPEPNLEFEGYATVLKRMKPQVADREKLEALQKRIGAVDYEIARLRPGLTEVEERLKGVDAEEPRKLETKIQEMNRELGRLEGLVRAENDQLALDLEAKGEFERVLASISQDEVKLLGKRIDAVRSIAKVFDDAIEAYRSERRSDIEKIATGIFKKIRSKTDFASLKINEQFGLSIVTQAGTVFDRAEWRSSGEEQIVALSLIGALNKCAQASAPVFMDTPLGRLDVQHGERVLRYLPSLSEQVVLLVTDREFRKGDEAFLDGKIKSDFTLSYQSEKDGSRIVQTSSVGG